jgi:hypothetical protein
MSMTDPTSPGVASGREPAALGAQNASYRTKLSPEHEVVINLNAQQNLIITKKQLSHHQPEAGSN